MENLELQRDNRLDEDALAQMGAKQGITASEWLETLKARRYIAMRYAMHEPIPLARDESLGVQEEEEQRALEEKQLALAEKQLPLAARQRAAERRASAEMSRAIAEAQRTSAETQRASAERQKAMAEAQQAMAERQGALEDEQQAVAERQREFAAREVAGERRYLDFLARMTTFGIRH